MKIVQVHNRYFSGDGGEDTVVNQEYRLLTDHGHGVHQVFVQTQEEDIQGVQALTSTALKSIWSVSNMRMLEKAISDIAPDVVHFHNTFPLLSPSAYSAAKNLGVPVVHSLHNYRLICANGLFLRDNRICVDCVGNGSLSALRHRCYKNSLAATIPQAAVRTIHKKLGTYDQNVDRFIVQTEFAKSIFVKDGFRSEQLAVKPNFIEDPLGDAPVNANRRKTIVFVGRLVDEKAVDLLMAAWKRVESDFELLIIGDGPDREKLQMLAEGQRNVRWLGWLDRRSLLQEVANCSYLVLSSRWYEAGLPLVVIEGLAVGTPAIVPNLGAIPELVGAGRAGLVFEGASIESLAKTITRAIESPCEWSARSANARKTYLANFTPELNYKMLMSIYESVIKSERVTA